MSSLIEFARGFFATTIAFNGNSLSVTWGSLIFAFVLPVVGLFLVIRVLVFFVKRLLAKSPMKEETRSRVMRWFRIVYRLVFLFVVALLAADLLGDQIMESLQSVIGFLREPFFTSGNTSISVVTLLLLVPIFYAATWAGNSTRRVLEQGVLDRLSLDASRKFSIVSLSRYGVMIIVAVIGLSIVGINLSSLAVIFGVLGLGIGFGLQGVVANLFAGLMIILSRPIKEGDRVQIAGLEGDVKQIRVLYSVVNTLSDETLIIPNREIVENIVHNQSYDQPSIILFTDVQVSYRSDLDKVKAVLTRVGEESSFLHDGKQPRVLFRSFDDSGITVTLAVPIRSAIERHIATSEIMMDIWRAFRGTGIEIPFPQMDLYVKQVPPALEPGGEST
ncbi:MAG TPA: mechanosensitive ion channel domain-containing protein [Spirochaetia bacterium]|nr:mechanosensitive ion channel domain-containing protein [Spirochaetia bacterium]